jgi:hypothetical protein
MTSILVDRRTFLKHDMVLLRETPFEGKPIPDASPSSSTPSSSNSTTDTKVSAPKCSICDTKTLTSKFTISDSEESAVKLPCNHVFGVACAKKYFNTLRPDDGQYNDRCPTCDVLLYAQDSFYERRASLLGDQTKSMRWWAGFLFFVAFTMMIFMGGIAISGVEIKLQWPWVFLFWMMALLTTVAMGKVALYSKRVSKEIDLEKGVSRVEREGDDQEVHGGGDEVDGDSDTEVDVRVTESEKLLPKNE